MKVNLRFIKETSFIFILLVAFLLTGCSNEINIKLDHLPSSNYDLIFNLTFIDLNNLNLFKNSIIPLYLKPNYKNSIKIKVSNYNLIIYIYNIKPNEHLKNRFINLTETQKRLINFVQSFEIKKHKKNFRIDYNHRFIKLNPNDIFSGDTNLLTNHAKEIILNKINKIYQKSGIRFIVFIKKINSTSYDYDHFFNLFVISQPKLLGLYLNRYYYFNSPYLHIYPSIFAINYGKSCFFVPHTPLNSMVYQIIKKKSRCTNESDIINYIIKSLDKINKSIISKTKSNLIRNTLLKLGFNLNSKVNVMIPRIIQYYNNTNNEIIQRIGNSSIISFRLNLFDVNKSIEFKYKTKKGLSIVVYSSLIFLIFLIIIIFVFVNHFKTSRNNRKQGLINSQSLNVLASYIKSNLDRGIPPDVSKIYLRKSGWSNELIDEAINLVNKGNSNDIKKINNITSNPSKNTNIKSTSKINYYLQSNQDQNISLNNNPQNLRDKTNNQRDNNINNKFDLSKYLQNQKQIINQILSNLDEDKKRNLINYIIALIQHGKTEREILNKLELYGWQGKEIKIIVTYLYHLYSFYKQK